MGGREEGESKGSSKIGPFMETAEGFRKRASLEVGLWSPMGETMSSSLSSMILSDSSVIVGGQEGWKMDSILYNRQRVIVISFNFSLLLCLFLCLFFRKMKGSAELEAFGSFEAEDWRFLSSLVRFNSFNKLAKACPFYVCRTKPLLQPTEKGGSVRCCKTTKTFPKDTSYRTKNTTPH